MYVLIASMMVSLTIFSFSTSTDISGWQIVDDVVMGGRSSGSFYMNQEGHGVFEGHISLENYGGFSSVRYGLNAVKEMKGYEKFVLRLKGDGKRYQFRLRQDKNEYFSHIAYFSTSGSWETIEIPFSEMYASFRGQKLDMPNYAGEKLSEIGFLIGNKKAESFRLLIDSIHVE